MSVGIFNYFETSDSSKIFKYSVNVFADLAALIGVENLDLAFVSTTTGIFGFRNLKGLYQYKGGAWVYQPYKPHFLRPRLVLMPM